MCALFRFALPACLVVLTAVGLHAAPGATELCRVKDNKAAIWTFISDDGLLRSMEFYRAAFKQRGLKGTIAIKVRSDIVFGFEASGPGGDTNKLAEIKKFCREYGAMSFGRKEYDAAKVLEKYQPLLQEALKPYRELLEGGFLEYQNHTFNHPKLEYIGQDPYRPMEMDFEVDGARILIERQFPHPLNSRVIGFIYPYGSPPHATEAAMDVIRKHHFAARLWWPRDADKKSDPAHPLESFEPADWYRLRTTSTGTADAGQPLASYKQWLDKAVREQKWCIFSCHGISDKEGGWAEGSEPIEKGVMAAYLDYVGAQAKPGGPVWCANFSEAIRYLRERQTASVKTVKAGPAAISLELADAMPDDLFDYPLTLKTEVPPGWENPVEVVQAGKAQSRPVVKEGEIKYVYFDAVPDRGAIELKPKP